MIFGKDKVPIMLSSSIQATLAGRFGTSEYGKSNLAHTGQNYDYNLNGVFFHDLKLENPEVYMDAVGVDLGVTLGNIINCSYKLMNAIQPDALLILGTPTPASLSL